MSWRQYQEETAEFFKSLGYEAHVEEVVRGARALHEVDVLVKFRKHQFDCMWIVECKDWKSSVPKEKIAALASIVADVGADKGIIISKSGFQSGAYDAATKTNILLTSLEELRRSHETELHLAFVDGLNEKVIRLNKRIRERFPGRRVKLGKGAFSVIGGPNLEIMGRLGLLEGCLRKLRSRHFPIAMDYTKEGGRTNYVSTVEDFVTAMRSHIKIVEDYLQESSEDEQAASSSY